MQRELIISCGAALYFLKLAIRYFGYKEYLLPISPQEAQQNLLAKLR
jgi:hypothetical protein